MSSLGILSITVVECKLSHDVKLLRTMDPYVKLASREQDFRTPTCESGGKKPSWTENNVFDIDVKYLGDDLIMVVRDDDPGKDELIGTGDSKLSAFAVYDDWDEWFTISCEDKFAGKIHLRSHWKPVHIEKPQPEDDMGKVQSKIKELAAKKRELTEEYNKAKSDMARHQEEGQRRIDAEKAEEEDDDKWNTKIARAEKRAEDEHERCDKMKEDLDDQMEEFEKKRAYELEKAEERKEEFIRKLDEAAAKAEADRDAALAKALEDKAACEEENLKRRHEAEEKIEGLNGAARRREEQIRDEISETAEKLLKVNERIREHLEKLAAM